MGTNIHGGDNGHFTPVKAKLSGNYQSGKVREIYGRLAQVGKLHL